MKFPTIFCHTLECQKNQKIVLSETKVPNLQMSPFHVLVIGSARSAPSELGQPHESSLQETLPSSPIPSPRSLASLLGLHCCCPVPPGVPPQGFSVNVCFHYQLDCHIPFTPLQRFNLCPHLTPEPPDGASLQHSQSPSSNPLMQTLHTSLGLSPAAGSLPTAPAVSRPPPHPGTLRP